MKISVKVGSNQLSLNISKKTICDDLIKMALIACKIGIAQKKFFLPTFTTIIEIDKSVKSKYGLFERAIGIERQIDADENISQLWLKWNSGEQVSQMQFIVKLLPTKSMLVQHKIEKNCQNSQRLFKHYKKQLKTMKYSFEQEHEYETIQNNVSYHQLVNKSPTASSVTYSISSFASDEKPLL